MENIVFLTVLFAAACHAGWNALIKVGLDPLSTTTLISIGSGVVALAFIPLVGVPVAAPDVLSGMRMELVEPCERRTTGARSRPAVGPRRRRGGGRRAAPL